MVQASTLYTDQSQGVLLSIGDDQRWFSYDVLYWHEIINDTIGGTPVAVTFCPLCGSAIAFDRRVGEEILEFGVSGKLWQSNLLMYDRQTESLWSQIEGTAKVGDFTDKSLAVINSDITTWEDVRDIAGLKILSHDTGYERNYGQNPYGTYEADEDLFFPVDNLDTRLHPKTIMLAGQFAKVPFAVERLALVEKGSIELEVAKRTLTFTTNNGKISVVTDSGEPVPTFNTMWFSWANHWLTKDAVIWAPGEKGSVTETQQASTNENKAATTIVEYFSYGCSYCDRVHDELSAVLKARPDTKISLKHFIVYSQYLPIHSGQICAAEQGKGYEFHHEFFETHYPSADPDVVTTIAQKLQLDQALLSACLDSSRPGQRIQNDMIEASRLGVRGTPTLLIQPSNGRLQALNVRQRDKIIEVIDTLKQ